MWISPFGNPFPKSPSSISRIAYVSKPWASRWANWVRDEFESDEIASLPCLASDDDGKGERGTDLLPREVAEALERRESMLRTLRRMVSSWPWVKRHQSDGRLTAIRLRPFSRTEK